MSVLGQAARTYLAAYSGYAAYLPGGISPDQTPQTTASLPYAVYQSTGKQLHRLLGGTVVAETERVSISIVANTRLSAQASAAWLDAAIAAVPGRQTIGTVLVHQWTVETETASDEVFGDGSDESARIIQIDLVGSYTV